MHFFKAISIMGAHDEREREEGEKKRNWKNNNHSHYHTNCFFSDCSADTRNNG